MHKGEPQDTSLNERTVSVLCAKNDWCLKTPFVLPIYFGVVSEGGYSVSNNSKMESQQPPFI